MTLGKRLKELREMRGFSQTGLAKKAGVSQATVSDYENDEVREHRAHVLMRLAATLETTTDYLVKGVGPSDASSAKNDQEMLLDAFNKLGDSERSAIIAVAQSLLHGRA